MTHNYSKNKSSLTPVSVVGARGYSGLELVRLLLKHPGVQLQSCFATQAFDLSKEIMDLDTRDVACLAQQELMTHLTPIVFLATPAEVSAELAPKILAQGSRVIDLSGAFRLQKSDGTAWYGFKSPLHADYGLNPFCGPAQDQLIANPGCYATAISMALIPLLKHRVIDANSIFIDAKSGSTGAGRKAAENLLFAEVDGDCLPYRVGRHQHLPEIVECIESFTNVKINPHFVTHLLPTRRGISAGIYAEAPGADIQLVEQAYQSEFGNYPLVRFGSDVSKFARMQKVVGTPATHISYEMVGTKLYVFSVIDNLLKGAASQAVENLNRLLDLPITTSLVEQSL